MWGAEEEDHEEYEMNGGDLSLYDSRTADIDEIISLRDILTKLSENNRPFYERMLTGVTDPE